ncbi:MAG: hypothetical protein AAFQ27_00915 [Pseudomonadota bacterium]
MRLELGITAVLAVGAGAFFLFDTGNPSVGPDYVRSEIYAKCDTDYLQSARHLGFKASESQCECFDDKLQNLSSAQQKAAYKSLEDRLTLAFMGKAGAKVDGSSVSFNDRALGRVDAQVEIETSGSAIIQQCSMF